MKILTEKNKGFTLTEMIVATTLTLLISGAALESFLFMNRSIIGLSNYGTMEAQARYGLEVFARDARCAIDISGVSSAADANNISTITMTVPVSASSSQTVVYNWDTTSNTFTRTIGGTTTNLVPNVRLVRFTPYKLSVAGASSNRAANDNETEQIQIRLEAQITRRGTVSNTNIILSARYILRNKDKTS